MKRQAWPDETGFTPPPGWEALFKQQLYDAETGRYAPGACELLTFVRSEVARGEVYPPVAEVFRAFYEVPREQVRVVILGQDPYHERGQAHGLSFSVPDGVRLPPSLRNIYKELYADLGVPDATPLPTSGDLSTWAAQGVLLLNSVLTVSQGAAASHRGRGWERFTDAVLQELNASPFPIAFLLWGRDARSKARFLTNGEHLVLQSEHPSPLSAYRGFFGSRPFSAVNAYLKAHGEREIDWVRQSP